MRLAVMLLTCLGASSCSILTLTSDRQEELERNRALWARVAPDAYEYSLRRHCFCGPDYLGPVRISVGAGGTVSRAYVDSGASVPDEIAEVFPTVDGLFELLQEAIDRRAFELDVLYDSATGVPVDVWIDYLENAVDEELGLEVTESVRETASG